MDFSNFYKQYEELVAKADQAFNRMKSEYPDQVRCEIKCSDCCYAFFDLTLIEALYINYRFHEKYQGEDKSSLLEEANKTDRFVYKIRRQIRKEFDKDLESGKDEESATAEIISKISRVRVRCPLLNQQEQCALYEYRPITCRLYGIPTAIWGKGHICGKSGFIEGQTYPTANLDIIQKKLYDISDELVKSIQTRDSNLAEIVVPLSTAILTTYDDEYLQIKKTE